MLWMDWLLRNSRPVIVRFLDAKRPERKFRTVVLPEPDGPIMAVKLPGLTIPSMLLMINLSSLTVLNLLPTFLFTFELAATVNSLHLSSMGFLIFCFSAVMSWWRGDCSSCSYCPG
jgi:hypothetical protein